MHVGSQPISATLVAALLQTQRSQSDAGALGCLTCGGFFIAMGIALAVANIVMLVWVARDAKSRGMDGAVLWVLLVFFTGPLGLIIYVFSRPNGALRSCPSCPNKRLEASAKCPHCGNA